MSQCCLVEAPASLAGQLAALFPTLVGSSPSAGRTDVRIVQRRSSFSVIHAEAERCATEADALSAAELAVTRCLLASERRHCHLHAAAARAGGGTIVALGPSGSGKSSLAYAWYRMDRPLLGDDVVALDPTGRIHAFPRPLKVDAERLREAGEVPGETVAWDPTGTDVWVDPTRRAGWATDGARVRLLVDIRFVPGARIRIRRVPAAGGVRMLLDSVHRTGASREESLDRLVRVAEEAEACQMEFGDARAGAEHLLEVAASWIR